VIDTPFITPLVNILAFPAWKPRSPSATPA